MDIEYDIEDPLIFRVGSGLDLIDKLGQHLVIYIFVSVSFNNRRDAQPVTLMISRKTSRLSDFLRTHKPDMLPSFFVVLQSFVNIKV